MTRVAVALAVVIALAAGVWMLWPDGERTPSTTTTLPIAASSSTTSTPAGTTTTADDHIVETVEEAEAILRELWFGWFEGIYTQDEDRIREVVESDAQTEAAKEQFGVMQFEGVPTASGISFSEIRILQANSSCLVTWSVTRSPQFLAGSEDREGVDVFRIFGDRWRLVSSWKYERDLWQSDCGTLPG